VTRIVVLPADMSACGYYRMRLPAGAVTHERPDWKVEIYKPSQVVLGVGLQGELWSVRGIPEPDKIDLLVMQRVATRAQVEFIQWARANGTAVVADADDAMWAIHPQNAAHDYWNGKEAAHWRYLDHAANAADLTTVTTEALAKRYGKHGRCEVLPNCVPADLQELLEPIRDTLDPTPTVGWAGNTVTHPTDLCVVEDAVRRAQEDTGCVVRVVGDAAGAARDWGMPREAVDHVHHTPIGLPYYTALTTLDIGLVPLQDGPFNRAKSYLKALEYAACGVAVVASPTPANRELAKRVPIRLASTPAQWYDHITDLVMHPDKRAEEAERARQQVFRLHTYEANARQWIAVWERALSRRARMSA
jgi:glycosyltransferase involved in cell wall biosynthesis